MLDSSDPWSQQPKGAPVADAVARRLGQVVAIFLLALIGVVWPLWGLGDDTLLQIPWLRMLCQTPRWVDPVAMIAVGLGGGMLLFTRRRKLGERIRFSSMGRMGLLLLTAGLAVLALLDQHRLQPWLWQFILFGVVFLTLPAAQAIRSWQIAVASLYVWSAISKIDAAFLTAHGPLLLAGMLQPLGIETAAISEGTRTVLVAGFPLGELLVGCLLLTERTGKYGLRLSIVMHLLLIWTLGVGLQHEWGVLLWNLFFVVQNLILFQPRPRDQRSIEAGASLHPGLPGQRWRFAGPLLTFCVATYPALELIGLCDHWPAWAVYSSRPAQVRVFLNEEAALQLPTDLQNFVGQPAPLEERAPLSLDAWSFRTCRCPVYPQLRYRLSLAVGLIGPEFPDEAVEVEIALTPNRWTGKRVQLQLQGRQAIVDYCDRFWVNTQPRQ